MSMYFDMTDSLIKRSTEKLMEWIEANGSAGYDPYDLLGVQCIRDTIYSESPMIAFLPARLLNYSINSFPYTCRKVFRIKKSINAKGIGLLASAYIHRAKYSDNSSYFLKAKQHLDWLISNFNSNYPGMSWGYPFDWQSVSFIPQGTPSSVVSSTIGHAFYDAYKYNGDESYLNVCKEICEFFIKGLNCEKIDRNTICFSYTPVDTMQVHNANLFVAEFLTRIGKESGNHEYFEKGEMAGNYALKDQLTDGSINYFATPQHKGGANRNDHYHVGFEIRMLYGLWKNTLKKEYADSFNRYYDYYLKNLLYTDANTVFPKMYPYSSFPLDIHACAEAIILNAELMDVRPEAAAVVEKVADWVVNSMQKRDGSFAYMLNKFGPVTYRTNISYLRWGQAWMFLALNKLLMHLILKNKI